MPIATRKPWVAGLLSLLMPGLGQMYNGQVKKGLFFYCFSLAVKLTASFLIIALWVPFNFVIPVLLGLSFLLYILLDAIRTAKRLGDTYQLRAYNKWYAYLIAFVLLSLVVEEALDITRKEVIAQSYRIPSGAMIPTLQIGDRILVDKLAYGVHIPFWGHYMVRYRKPERGDIVIFAYPKDRSKDFIKRVIGLEGDLLEIRKKKVYIDGQLVKDPHAHFEDGEILLGPFRSRDNYGPETVPENNVFVLGDNRDRSHDSRFWGFLDIRDVKGKAFIIYWSWDGTDRWVRWERIGVEIQ